MEVSANQNLNGYNNRLLSYYLLLLSLSVIFSIFLKEIPQAIHISHHNSQKSNINISMQACSG